MRGDSGFTLLELLIALSILLILLTMSLPSLNSMRSGAAQKESARKIFAALRQARSLSITENLEYQVMFDLDQQIFWLERGDRADKSTSWDRVRDYGGLTGGNRLQALAGCTATSGQRKIQFNPNGSANTLYVCAIEPKSSMRYRVGVPIARTGRPVIQRDTGAKGQWH